MRSTPALVLLALAACAPGDIRLTDAEVVSRGRVVELRETLTRRVFEANDGRAYFAHCLEGWQFRDGVATVVNVTGNRFAPRDFLVSAQPVDGVNGMLARVSHAGAVVPDEGVDRGTYVTLEFRLNCVDPQGS